MRHRGSVSRVLAAAVAAAMAVAGVGACSSGTSTQKVLADKGIPYGDQLVPIVTATVSDGAVGVSVDQPVTLSVAGGVLGPVSMVDDAGDVVPGQVGPDGVTWSTSEPLDYNQR